MTNVDAWIGRAVRAVGIAGLIYEILIDHVANPTALVVFGGLAEGPDLFQYWRAQSRKSRGKEPSG